MPQQQNYLTEPDMALLKQHGRVVSYSGEEVILSEDAENSKMFWLLKGRVRVELDRLFPGVTLAKIEHGEMFGEISFLSDDRASATVTADGKVEVLEVERDELERLLAGNEGFAARFYHTTSVTLIKRLRI
ncbi:MAG: cyclic nucleotide-binding domain-containing protein [Gammaproteobacteria bacterium]|nr:cyclic nucleotide-binding domain-containing protein [Gammaproteobacteria bacterium]